MRRLIAATCSQKNEGCRLWGDVQVAKVQGSMQLAPGKAYEHLGRVLHDMTPLRNVHLDISHSIAGLSFGQAYPGQINPLAGQVFDQRKKDKGNALQQTGARSCKLWGCTAKLVRFVALRMRCNRNGRFTAVHSLAITVVVLRDTAFAFRRRDRTRDRMLRDRRTVSDSRPLRRWI